MSDAATLALWYEGLSERLRPPKPISVSKWLSENLVLVDGPAAGQLWSPKGAPYLPEIADCLGDDHPCNLVTVRKSQQSGASILALGWTLYIAANEPANVLYAAPTIDALRELNTAKLNPLVEAMQRRTGKAIIEPTTSRSGSGSTTYEKVFAGGRIFLANANAVMDLSSKTIKKGVKDELSKWGDIPGYGDPETLFFGRFTAFRRRRNYKILEISTPEVDSGDAEGAQAHHCRIDRSFKRSDQRFWNVPCPQCGEFFRHEFKNLAIDEKDPKATTYTCPHCGCPIGDTARVPMIRAGKWVAEAPGPGRHPGFHIDAFVSLMMSYEAIAEDWLKSSGKGEIGKKDFTNLTLGLPYAYKSDAPDHVRLLERREEGFVRGHVPARGLLLVASADVQMRGMWVLVEAFAPNRESWVVDAFYIDGSTESPDAEAFQQLERLADREFPDAFGGLRKLDALGVDSGYRSHVVYSWARAKQRKHPNSGQDVILALDGRDGWGKPPIGTPSLVDINLLGKKILKGARVWPVGTWPLKGSFYSDLAKIGVKGGAEEDPAGYFHAPDWLDEAFFKQITSEHLAPEVHRGRPRRVWKISSSERDNHFLDCAVYNRALAEHLGLSTITKAEWKSLAEERGMAPAPAPAPAGGATPPVQGPDLADVTPAVLADLLKRNAQRFS